MDNTSSFRAYIPYFALGFFLHLVEKHADRWILDAIYQFLFCFWSYLYYNLNRRLNYEKSEKEEVRKKLGDLETSINKIQFEEERKHIEDSISENVIPIARIR